MRVDVHLKADGKVGPDIRRHPRALFTVPIVLYHLTPQGLRTTEGISLDLSEGGLGALVKGELRVGETVEIELGLNRAARKHGPLNRDPLKQVPLNAVAIVRHSSEGRSGFEFLGLTAEERLAIRQAVGPS